MAEADLVCSDPSDYRPENKAAFRDYAGSSRAELVRETYRLMHTSQTVAFVEEKRQRWCRFNHTEMTVMEALDELNRLVDGEYNGCSSMPMMAV